ncbi:hypothetical protein GLYMA_08G260100v4 [Glycine max]|uniref:RNase H type-1 domain-containing protein n=2 Tax=Glycine subgen. Soja TaxID=1462606 RepID=A0A0R0IZC0_SOYBN|nr:hypothetical protein JHK87_022420 [Glycine soja]KAH1053137.1 hypothetical protein GYH30_022434 [Glycine max]KRH45243.1 hypothetical protein GLYMA_08G260100v4 [Glycine max]RZB98879.1 hypothetical protein D0Y65_021659 [Glycine soja]
MDKSLKINIDATIFKEVNKFGVGICIKGDQGSFVSAKSLPFDDYPALLSNFSNSVVSFIKKPTNSVAHSLTRASISYACIQVFFNHIFSCIFHHIINEMS